MSGGASVLNIGEFAVATVESDPPWYQNCYVVRHVPSGATAVIDPGADATRIGAALGQAAAPQVLLTHGHPDHVMGLRDVQDAFDAPCRAHADERTNLEQAPAIAGALMGMQLKAPRSVDYFPGEPTLRLGDVAVRVIHTPGHTPGGVCYDFGGFVITGDTLFNQGVGRTDLPGGDSRALAASIGRLLDLVDEPVVILPGHGPQWTVGEARQWWKWMM